MPDHCRDTVCENGGLCVDGHCACLNGYEGERCAEVWNERFLGTWTSKDVVRGAAAGDTLTHQIRTATVGRADQFLTLNLSLSYDSVFCIRRSYDEFSFAANQQLDSMTVLLDGTGVMDSVTGQVRASYRVRVNNQELTHDLHWSR